MPRVLAFPPKNMAEEYLSIGTFVTVGESIGVIIGWPNCNEIPEGHYAVWYGEMRSDDCPLCRTVPIDYCTPIAAIEYYH